MAYSTTGLPVIPYTLTTTIDGIKYETHVLTNTCQVITEDGVTLCDILKDLVTSNDLKTAIGNIKPNANTFRYKGALNDVPGHTAIQQLFEKVGMQNGDVYLVQISTVDCTGKEHVPSTAYDMYCWIKKVNRWVWFGSTQRNPDLDRLPTDTLKIFPATLGKPGEMLMTAADGETLVWGTAEDSGHILIEKHNQDPECHEDIRKELSTKATRMKIFNTTIQRKDWYWNGDGDYFCYLFKDERLGPHTYFEITPVAVTWPEINTLRKASLHSTYVIDFNDTCSYALLHADHVPDSDIRVCVKAFGDYDDV